MTAFSEDKQIYTGRNKEYKDAHEMPAPISIPEAPPWRRYAPPPEKEYYQPKEAKFKPFTVYGDDTVDLVNMAIYLHRPLLVTGDPGVGKTSLAYDIAYELQLGSVLEWPITSRTSLQDGLYRYDAMGRLHAAALYKKNSSQKATDLDADIGEFITLGALGTALVPRRRPRLLLIDEFDKSDYDLPNDLLYVLEKGEFEIPELKRIKKRPNEMPVRLHDQDDEEKYTVINGKISCAEFPIIIITSNEERQLPAPFLRRCIRLEIPRPDPDQLSRIIEKHLSSLLTEEDNAQIDELIKDFEGKLKKGEKVSNDQLLNAVFLVSKNQALDVNIDFLKRKILEQLGP